MKVLVVCSSKQGDVAPFVKEQVDALCLLGIDMDYYLIEKKGIKGYLASLAGLKAKINRYHPDLVHAHYGLSGLLANLQRKIPVITTFHGSDINDPKVRRWSKIAIWLSRYSIFVSRKTINIACPHKNYDLIPCGVDTELFHPIDKSEARRLLGWSDEKYTILFAGAFDNEVKNYPLAKAATDQLSDVRLIELSGYSREQVNLLMNAVDIALLTSFSEGSPQFIKEAMACNCPIVATDVGDVRELIENVDGCYCTSFSVQEVTSKLHLALGFVQEKGRTSGRDKLINELLEQATVANRISTVYKQCINNHD